MFGKDEGSKKKSRFSLGIGDARREILERTDAVIVMFDERVIPALETLTAQLRSTERRTEEYEKQLTGMQHQLAEVANRLAEK